MRLCRFVAYASPLLASTLGAQRVTKDAKSAPADSTGYHVVHSMRLGGPGGWDYLAVDTAGHRLFVTRGTHVMVVDTRTDSLVGDIGDTPGVHGVALAPELGRGWTSNGRDSTITEFDYATLAPLKRIREPGANPDAITYDAATKRVFAFNGRTGDAVVIDATTDSVLTLIPLGGKPEFAVTDGRGMLWVNVEDKSEIAAVDTRTLAVTRRWSIKPCEEPSGLAIDREHRRLFSVCDDVMAISDPDAGKVVATVKIGGGPDATAYDAERGLAFASNGEDGTISVVHQDGPDTYRVVQTLKTKAGARTMTLDPSTHALYTVTADFLPATGGGRPGMKPDSFTLLVIEP
jgi:DNA-binding beta-propeller fold protein YncE